MPLGCFSSSSWYWEVVCLGGGNSCGSSNFGVEDDEDEVEEDEEGCEFAIVLFLNSKQLQ